MRGTTSTCPAKCSVADPHQRYLYAEDLRAAGLDEDWVTNAMQCACCGEVYSIGSQGEKVRRGHFGGNTLMTAENWIPFHRTI